MTVHRRLCSKLLFAGAALAVAAAPAQAADEPEWGELGKLIDAVEPPPRFADHDPGLHVRDVEHTYWWWDEGDGGPGLAERETTLRVIFDGVRP